MTATKRRRGSAQLPVSHHELQSLEAALLWSNDHSDLPLAQKRDCTRIVERCARLRARIERNG